MIPKHTKFANLLLICLLLVLNNYGTCSQTLSADTTPTAYAIVIGISTYSNTEYNVANLQFCVDDARDFAAFLKKPEGGGLTEENIKLLTEDNATKENILKEAAKLFSKAKEKDRIIFFFSGHGGPNFFLTYDSYIKHDELKEILYNSKAKSKFCFADACHSGTWDKKIKIFTKDLTDEEVRSLYNESFNVDAGLALFMSCKPEEVSLEDSSLKHGLFAYYLIEGLSGKADIDSDHFITFSELYDYVKDKVESRAFQSGHLQTPVMNGIINMESIVAINRSTGDLSKQNKHDNITITNGDSITDNIYEIKSDGSNLSYMYIPKEAIWFCVYLQDKIDTNKGSCVFLDNLINKETFVSKMDFYIQSAKNENKKLIISSDDGTYKWITNNKIMYGTDRKNLKHLGISPLWHPVDEKVYMVTGLIDF